MKYGIELGATGDCGDPRTLAHLARLAEEAGWDGIFLEDYIVHWSGGTTYDPWIALAAMALNTERVRLGTTVTPLARRRPWKVARETVTLDHLSGGRLVLGVGLGVGNTTDFAGFGEAVDDRQRAQILDEALVIIDGLWRGETFHHQGDHFTVAHVTCLPKPVQTPRIPIWIGGTFPKKGPLTRAVRWDGAVFYKQPNGQQWVDMTPEDVRSLKTLVDSQRSATTPFDIAVGGRERHSDWGQERAYIRDLASAGATWWLEGIEPTTLAETQVKIQRGPLFI